MSVIEVIRRRSYSEVVRIKNRDHSSEARNDLGVSESCSEHLWMATELIGMVPVKLFNRKCSGIIFGEKLFYLDNLLKLILVGAALAATPRWPHTKIN